MKKSVTLFLAALCQLTINSLNAFQLDQVSSLEMSVNAILANHTGDDKPGATIGIIKDGELIFQKGYGMADLKSRKANNAQVIYNIASGSKQFTAVVVAALIHQKKLALTDHIGEYLPEFPDYGRDITIENLLYHTSGIRDYMALMWLTGKSFEEPINNKDALAIIIRQNKLNFDPGDRCVYSNSNYILLAEIIHRITGKTLAEYTDQHLLKAIGMHCSGFGGYNIEKKYRRAISYSKLGNAYLPLKNNYAAYGDGGMLTTLEDLALWDREFYDRNSLVQQILKRGKLNDGNRVDFGMGIIISTYRDELIQTHSGAFLGFRSEILRFPEKNISIICLGNSEDINPELITRTIADVYVFKDRSTTALVQTKINSDKAKGKLTAERASAFTGIYEVAPDILVHIRYEYGMLSGQVSGQARQMLYPNSNNTFSISSTNDQAVFENLNAGKFQQLTVVQNQGNTNAKRVCVLSPEDHSRYAGIYYSEEQNTTYKFYSKNGNLWFKVGANAELKAEVLSNYNRIYFDYKNLELATIDFSMDSKGMATGFMLSSGRVSGIQFVKK